MGRVTKRIARDIKHVAKHHPDFRGMSAKQVLDTMIAAVKNDPSAVAHVESALINTARAAKWEKVCRKIMKEFPALAKKSIQEVYELIVKSGLGDQSAIRKMKEATGGVLPPDDHWAG